MPSKSLPNLNRRGFLKAATGAVVGSVVAPVVAPVVVKAGQQLHINIKSVLSDNLLHDYILKPKSFDSMLYVSNDGLRDIRDYRVLPVYYPGKVIAADDPLRPFLSPFLGNKEPD